MTAKVFVKLACKLDAERRAVLGFESEEDDDTLIQRTKPSNYCRFSSGTRFDQLEVEGSSDESLSEKTSPDGGNRGFHLGQTEPERETSLLDDDIPDGFKLVANKHAHLQPQAPDRSSSASLRKGLKEVGPNGVDSQLPSMRKEMADRDPDYLEYKQWIPPLRSSFWKAYSNKLRVNRIETGVCDLNG
jgi:hypothetical protein